MSGVRPPEGAYGPSFAAVYDRITRQKDYEAEVEALAALIGADARVLDVGCGTGTHSALLARRGYDVVALDQSAEMVARARAKCPALRVELGEVAELADRDFTFTISLFNVANCLGSLDALIDFMGAISARLTPGGRLLVEAWNPVAVIAEPPTTVERVFEDGDGTIRRTVVPRPDFLHQRLELDYMIEVLDANGERDPAASFTVTHPLVLFTPLEVEYALERAGFEDVAVLSALPDLRPATASDRMLAFLARRADVAA